MNRKVLAGFLVAVAVFAVSAVSAVADGADVVLVSDAAELRAAVWQAGAEHTVIALTNDIETNTLVIPPNRNITLTSEWLETFGLTANIQVRPGAELALNNISVTHVDVLNGTFTLNGGVINFGVIVGGINGNFVMNGGTAGTVNVVSGTFAMNGGTSGGVVVGGSFVMNGGVITDRADRITTEGVTVFRGGTFTMNGGEIRGNTNFFNGGGVFVNGGAVFTMNDGFIISNTANRGGGVYVDEGGIFNMYGGQVNSNAANVGNCVYGGGEFNFNGGLIAYSVSVTTANEQSHDSVVRAVSAGLVRMRLRGDYQNAITRAEFAALAAALYEAVTDDTILTWERGFRFFDVICTDVSKASAIGVMFGVGNDMFAPDVPLTREQAAIVLARLANAAGQPLPVNPPNFADSGDIAYWAVEAVGQVQAAGIMHDADGLFNPQGTLTREQGIIMILELYDKIGSIT